MTQSFDIEQFLEQLGADCSNQISFINNGGCAVFAALVGRQLSKFIPVKILVHDWIRNNASDITNITPIPGPGIGVMLD